MHFQHHPAQLVYFNFYEIQPKIVFGLHIAYYCAKTGKIDKKNEMRPRQAEWHSSKQFVCQNIERVLGPYILAT